MPAKHIAPGTVFGRLTVQGIGVPFVTRKGWHTSASECLCECGKTVTVRNCALRCGNTRSCDCIKREKSGARFRTHGQSAGKNPSGCYRSWLAMKQRTSEDIRYIARGITVCDRWSSFENFRADMGERPTPKHELERVNNDLGYFPENCKWATRVAQVRNRRVTRMATVGGITCSFAEMCELMNVPYRLAHNRVSNGWTDEEAFTLPRLTRWSRLRKPKADSIPRQSRAQTEANG